MGREAGTEKAIHYAAGFTAAGFNDFWNHMDYNVRVQKTLPSPNVINRCMLIPIEVYICRNS